MKPQNIRLDDWGHFIQMDKRDWRKIKRWLKAHGVTVQETVGKLHRKVST